MTYSNQADQFPFVQPSGLLRFSDANATSSFTSGDKVILSDVEHLSGNNVATISGTGVITLPAGYYYLLEGSLSVGDSAGGNNTNNDREIYTRFYNETTSSYIGVESFQIANRPYYGDSEAHNPVSRDETARCWVDATAGSVDVSWRMSNVLYPYTLSDTIYPITGLPTLLWVAWTRCLVWRFD